MNFVDEGKLLVGSKEVQEASLNIVVDAAEAVLGNPIAVAKLLLAVEKTPFFLQNQLFWVKFEAFLNGSFIDEESRAKMAAVFAGKGDREDNAVRLLATIDKVDSMSKIKFLNNATRCLLAGFIDLTQYFRICRAISDTLLEDLLFLRDHIKEESIFYNEEVQGLISSGLMYMSDLEEETAYSFTPSAFILDQYAISYNDVDRYPNPTRIEEKKKLDVHYFGSDFYKVGEV